MTAAYRRTAKRCSRPRHAPLYFVIALYHVILVHKLDDGMV